MQMTASIFSKVSSPTAVHLCCQSRKGRERCGDPNLHFTFGNVLACIWNTVRSKGNLNCFCLW